MANNSGILADAGNYPLDIPQTGGFYQLTLVGNVASGATVTLQTAPSGTAAWAPAGKDATDALFTVPGTKCIRTSDGFQYRLVVAGGTWSSENFTAYWGLANG